jgi:hypothetical protein
MCSISASVISPRPYKVLMQANPVIREYKLGAERHFALCESCFWSATVFGSSISSCPSCTGDNVSTIPLVIDEQYGLKVSGASLEMSFSRAKKP